MDWSDEMTILSRDVLPHCGPYIEFADCPKRLEIGEHGWPARPLSEEYLFFEMGDDLLGAICSLTKIPCFFDIYEYIQVDEPQEIRAFAVESLRWATQLEQCSIRDYEKELWICQDSPYISMDGVPSAAGLKADLIETLLFITGRMNRMADKGRCLVVVGI